MALDYDPKAVTRQARVMAGTSVGSGAGSAFGPWGTLIGAGVGAVSGLIGAGMQGAAEKEKAERQEALKRLMMERLDKMDQFTERQMNMSALQAMGEERARAIETYRRGRMGRALLRTT